MAEFPTGTVTFFFTDVEGSTRLTQTLGDGWPPVLEAHDAILRNAIRSSGGIEIRTEGDSFFAVFAKAPAAVDAATATQRALAAHDWPKGSAVRVRIGMHTGEGTLGGDNYVGLDVHRAARIAAAGHGGQVLVSSTTNQLAEGALPPGVELRDLGFHRLKDLARPERIYQLTIEDLPNEFPQVRSLETPTNVPVPRTSFVGRERDVARVKEMLRGPGLLTLLGPGGTGKTRLALEAARQLLSEYPDGVFFVALETVTDPRMVQERIAASIGLRSEGMRSDSEILLDHTRERQMLLVLDNFEQIAEGAGIVGELLESSPRTRILATSREPLHLAGEQQLQIEPLVLPPQGGEVEDVARSESVGLFVQRASALDPGFRLDEDNAGAVAELCRRLDGLPLAIELAASRVKMLSPEAILDRLERRLELLSGGPVDAPARQRSLRETIAWSHELLLDAERTLFRRLAVFAGGWSLDAVDAVGNAGSGADVLSGLTSLVDKSLVTRSSDTSAVRFGMLESIRQFAAEQLEAAGETRETSDRHASFFLGLAEAAEPNLRGVDQKRWLDELSIEHDNLRAALRHAIDSEQAETGLRLVAALWRFWHLRTHLEEGRRWSEEVLALEGAAARSTLRIGGLNALGGVTYWQENVPTFKAAYEEALEIARELGDRAAEAEGVYNMAFVLPYQGDFEGAQALFRQSLEMFTELGNRRGIADVLWLISIGARLGGDLQRSRELVQESLRLHREIGDRFGATVCLYALARVAFEQGDRSTSIDCLLEALDNDELIDSQTGIALVLDNLAAHATADDDHLRAVRLGGASEAIKEAAGGHAPSPLVGLPDPREAATPVLGESAVTAAWEEGRAIPLERVLQLAREAGA